MHDILMSLILGVVEGVTEFLPISSTAHLLVSERLLGLGDEWEAFTVVIQLGAILAVKKVLDEVLLNPAFPMPFIAGCWIVGGLIILVFERFWPKPRFFECDK